MTTKTLWRLRLGSSFFDDYFFGIYEEITKLYQLYSGQRNILR